MHQGHDGRKPPARPSGRFATDPTQSGSVRGTRAPLIGRATEMAQLREAVGRAVDFSAPQLVTVIGNPGTGKSRLIAELVAETERLGVLRVFHGRAEASGRSALTSLLRSRFVQGDDGELNRTLFLDELRLVVGAEPLPEVSHLLGGLIGLEFASSTFLRTITEDPRQRADVLRTALVRFVELDAKRSPLLLVLDDMHLADDVALTLVKDLAAGLGGSPVIMVVAAQPELLVRSPHWGKAGAAGEHEIDHLRIDLRNLEPDDAEAMFRALLTRCGPVPNELADLAVEQTGGNPLFLEQLVRLLIDKGAITTSANKGETWQLNAARALEIELPISVEQAIAARIAALDPEERMLLERAAVFGNVFWVSAVIAMTRRLPEGPKRLPLEFEWDLGDPVRRRVGDLIAALADRDYLLLLDQADSSIAGDTEVVFKHNLERDLIVRSTEPERLRELHVAAAHWLEARTGGRSEEQLEALAGLYERGGQAQRAAEAYLQIGDRARARYMPEAARAAYEKALALLAKHQAAPRIEVLHNLGAVLEQSGRGDEAMARFAEMLELAWLFDNLAKAGTAYRRLGRCLRRVGRYDSAMDHMRRGHDLFVRARDDRGVAATLDDMGSVHWLRGAFGQALDFHRQALSLRRALGDRRSIALSLANIGRVHCDSGSFRAAVAQFREALDIRRDIGDIIGVVQSLGDLASVHLAVGHPQLAQELLSEAQGLAKTTADKLALAEVLSKMGEACTALGKLPEAVAALAEAKLLAIGLGERGVLAFTHARLAEVHLGLGALSAAEEEALAAVSVSEATGLRVGVGRGYRVLGDVQTAQGHAAKADESFRRAIEVLAAVKHELELANAYRRYAAHKQRARMPVEAERLTQKADEIFARLRGAAAIE